VSESEALRAEPGMVLVHRTYHHEWAPGEECRTWEALTIGIVVSVDRYGNVKQFKTPAIDGRWTVQLGPDPTARCRRRDTGDIWLCPGVDPDRAIEIARAHHRPSHPGFPDAPMPYSTLAEVIDALAPLQPGAATAQPE
jgi:hypothetical protein